MTNGCSTTGSGWRSYTYVDVNIGEAENDGKYTDPCKNDINIHKDNNRPTSGYKKYTHTFSRSHYVGGINYNGTRQNGFNIHTGSSYYKGNVTVYYLGYDENNVLPLIVGITKGGNNYDYFRRTNYLTSNQWQIDARSSRENTLPSKLATISSQLKEFVVLRLDVTEGQYYADGTRSPPPVNPKTKINVSGPYTECIIYRKYSYQPITGLNIRLLSTKHGGKKVPFDPPVYGSEYREAYVYYWEGDSGHTNPLILQLGESTFYTLNGKEWNNPGDINIGTLEKKLDKLNCEKNQAHIIDISKNTSSGNYTCLTEGCKINIMAINSPYQYYSQTLHIITDGSNYIARFKDGKTEQTGLAFTSSTSNVYVYHCPKGPHGIPLLIYLPGSSNSWFQRGSLDSSTWTSVSTGSPSGYNDKSNILKLLRSKLPSVTINVGDTKVAGESGSGSTYKDPGTVDNPETISLTKNDVKVEDKVNTGYTSFVHSVQDKTYFVARDVKYSSDLLSGIPSNFILTSVTAYYEEGNLNSMDGLLMIGLEKKNDTPNNYAYYIRRENTQNNWTVVCDNTTKLESTSLTDKLNELKEKLETERKKLSTRDGPGLSPVVKKGLEIGGYTTLGLTTVGTIAGLVKKFWGTIATTLITSV